VAAPVPPPAAAAVPPPAAPVQPLLTSPVQVVQAPPVAAATTSPLQTGTAQKQYQGAPISLDFAGADIRSVLRVFSETSGLNIIIDPKVQGVVDVALRDVPWDQALEIILKGAQLGWVLDGNVVRIAPLSALADEESQRRKLADEQALGGTLETLTRTLSYALGKDLKNVLVNSVLTKRGQVQVDERTNTIIVRDLPAALVAAGQILDTLDKPQPQVEIEARIVQTSRNFSRQLGVQWGFSGQVSPALGNTTPLAFPNQGSLTGATGAVQGQDAVPSAVNLKTTGAPTSAVGLALGSVNGAFKLDVQLSALETQGKLRILSTPRVLAQNNFPAMMMQGVEIPIQTVANNTVTVTFKPAALTLEVTPQITAAGTVILNVKVENASPDYTKQINNIPPINTQRANTQVLVKDNDTIVIGGVYVSQEQSQNDHTPGLHKIPLLGWLFRRDIVDDQANELLIFITPRIIKG
jgi:type IV pilus assembly protein PilQ